MNRDRMELETLRRKLIRAEEEIAKLRVERNNAIAASLTDSLTGLPNRRHFDEVLAREVAQTKRGSGGISLAYFDGDEFGEINKNYGHAVGDMVLRLIADTLRSSLRTGDFCARVGGDEFIAILKTRSDADDKALEKRLREIWQKGVSLRLGQGELVATATIGLAKIAVDDDVESFKRRANGALHEAKEGSVLLRVVK